VFGLTLFNILFNGVAIMMLAVLPNTLNNIPVTLASKLSDIVLIGNAKDTAPLDVINESEAIYAITNGRLVIKVFHDVSLYSFLDCVVVLSLTATNVNSNPIT